MHTWVSSYLTNTPNVARYADPGFATSVEVWVAAPILAIELVANLYLSFGFVYQIWRTGFTNSQRLARNSLVAALFGLVITCANVIVSLLSLGYLHEC